MKLYLIRHPKPDVIKGLCYGQTDVALKQGWQDQSTELKQHIKQRCQAQSVVFFHSPLSRAQQLAEDISEQGSQANNALMELDFGAWENIRWQDIPKADIDLWFEDIVTSAPYKGESLQVLADRVWHWWQSVKDCGADNMFVVTHSGVIKVLVSLLCDWPLAQAHRIDVGFMSITELFIQDDYISLKRLGAGDWVI